MAYYKPQSPIKNGEDHIYPLTTVDQVMLDDGSRLNTKFVTVDIGDEETGTVPYTNADQLGGKPASEYALKSNTVSSINGKTGVVELTASDVGALSASGTAVDSEKLGGKTGEERMLDAYPVGSIYMSVNSTSPASLFGGTWEQLKDRFLLGAGDTYANGATGGEASHTLTVGEMPAHNHNIITAGNNTVDYNNSGASGSDGHGISVGANYNNMWTNHVGGSEPHNNMPPYLAVYMWKRTA